MIFPNMEVLKLSRSIEKKSYFEVFIGTHQNSTREGNHFRGRKLGGVELVRASVRATILERDKTVQNWKQNSVHTLSHHQEKY